MGMLLLLRAVLIASFLLVALAAGSVYFAQSLDDYRCLLLYDGYTVAPITYVLDTERGQLAIDRREVQRLFATTSPNGRYNVGFVQRLGERATMTLQVEDGDTTRIVQTGIDGTSTSDGYHQVAWARDSSAFAFMWRDEARRRYLTVGSADGTIRQTIPYMRSVDSHPTLDPVTIAGWSGDGNYVAVSEFSNVRSFYHFFDADTLVEQVTPLDDVPILYGELSPSGDLVAAITLDEGGAATLNIISISGGVDPIQIPLTVSALLWQVSWSPSGDFLVVKRISGCRTTACLEAGWHFDFYRWDGTTDALTATQRGIVLPNNPSAVLPAMWNGDRWVWAERIGDALTYNLSTLDMRTGARETLITNLVEDYADDMFYVPPTAEWSSIFTNFRVFPMSLDSRVIVPFYAEDGIAVDLLDTTTGERRPLLRGINFLMRTHYGFGSHFWSEDGESARIMWTREGETGLEAFITVVNVRDGTQVTSSSASRTIWRPQWVDSAHIGFIDPRTDGFSLYLLDTITGEQKNMLPIGVDTTYWLAALTPNGQLAAVTSGNSEFTGKPLTLINLRDDSRQVISESAAGSFLWSPDGERIAFGEYANRQANIVISDRTGTHIQRYYPPELAATPFIQFIEWTQC